MDSLASDPLLSQYIENYELYFVPPDMHIYCKINTVGKGSIFNPLPLCQFPHDRSAAKGDANKRKIKLPWSMIIMTQHSMKFSSPQTPEEAYLSLVLLIHSINRDFAKTGDPLRRIGLVDVQYHNYVISSAMKRRIRPEIKDELDIVVKKTKRFPGYTVHIPLDTAMKWWFAFQETGVLPTIGADDDLSKFRVDEEGNVIPREILATVSFFTTGRFNILGRNVYGYLAYLAWFAAGCIFRRFLKMDAMAFAPECQQERLFGGKSFEEYCLQCLDELGVKSQEMFEAELERTGTTTTRDLLSRLTTEKELQKFGVKTAKDAEREADRLGTSDQPKELLAELEAEKMLVEELGVKPDQFEEEKERLGVCSLADMAEIIAEEKMEEAAEQMMNAD